jgi:hypothetical protein
LIALTLSESGWEAAISLAMSKQVAMYGPNNRFRDLFILPNLSLSRANPMLNPSVAHRSMQPNLSLSRSICESYLSVLGVNLLVLYLLVLYLLNETLPYSRDGSMPEHFYLVRHSDFFHDCSYLRIVSQAHSCGGHQIRYRNI